MRLVILLAIDCLSVILATLAALALRENFQLQQERLIEFFPYVVATFGAALAVFSLTGVNRTVWRFCGQSDYIRVAAAVAATVAGALGLCFAYNRLDGVARSLPVLQFLTCTAFLTVTRVVHRFSHERRHLRRASASLLQPMTVDRSVQTILIVGVNRLAEIYLEAAAEMAPGQIRIAGLLGRAGRHTGRPGRLVATYPVLGTPETIETVLDSLEVHGVCVDRIVVATDFNSLSAEAQEALIGAERSRNLELRFIGPDLGLDFENQTPAGLSPSPEGESWARRQDCAKF